MMFGRKLVCVKCGLTVRRKDYDKWVQALLAGDSRTDCTHWFFDRNDTAGIAIGLRYEARRRAEA